MYSLHQGDSGGALVTKLCDGRYAQVGIVSYGFPCAIPNNPTVYTSVPFFTEWIEKNTGYFSC